jgi:hypothetical protein
MDRKQFEKILGAEKVAALKAEVVRMAEQDPVCSPDRLDLYQAIYGDCSTNEFTNEAVEILCALAVRFYLPAAEGVSVARVMRVRKEL